MTQRTHWDDCWKSGPEHYECAAGEVERLQARDEEWQRKASAWMASPEAVQWLDGYRELAQKLNAAEAEVELLKTERESLVREAVNQAVQTGIARADADSLRAEVERLRHDIERHMALLTEFDNEVEQLRAERAALRSDAERLDYIERNARKDPDMSGNHTWWPTTFCKALRGPTLRAAIDAAQGG